MHPLYTDIPKPERFTYPFCYEPHPLCLLAAKEVQKEIARIGPQEGKMFGVLVVEDPSPNPSRMGGESYYFLAAYTGLLEGRNDWEYFVPSSRMAILKPGSVKFPNFQLSILNFQLSTLNPTQSVDRCPKSSSFGSSTNTNC